MEQAWAHSPSAGAGEALCRNTGEQPAATDPAARVRRPGPLTSLLTRRTPRGTRPAGPRQEAGRRVQRGTRGRVRRGARLDDLAQRGQQRHAARVAAAHGAVRVAQAQAQHRRVHPGGRLAGDERAQVPRRLAPGARGSAGPSLAGGRCRPAALQLRS